MENQAVAKHERLKVLRSIYPQLTTYNELNSNTKVNQKDSLDCTTI